MKTSLSGSCDCCIIYRPETNFCLHQQNKTGATNIFFRQIYFRKFQILSNQWCGWLRWLRLGTLQLCEGWPKTLGSKLMNYPISYLILLVFFLGGYPKKDKGSLRGRQLIYKNRYQKISNLNGLQKSFSYGGYWFLW